MSTLTTFPTPTGLADGLGLEACPTRTMPGLAPKRLVPPPRPIRTGFGVGAIYNSASAGPRQVGEDTDPGAVPQGRVDTSSVHCTWATADAVSLGGLVSPSKIVSIKEPSSILRRRAIAMKTRMATRMRLRTFRGTLRARSKGSRGCSCWLGGGYRRGRGGGGVRLAAAAVSCKSVSVAGSSSAGGVAAASTVGANCSRAALTICSLRV